jgi:hypothetical protein
MIPTIVRSGVAAFLAYSFLVLVGVVVLLTVLNFPTVVVCDRAQQSVEVQVESTRDHARIEKSKFAGCVWYWHESGRGLWD